MKAISRTLLGGLLGATLIAEGWCGEWQLRESITDKNKQSSPASTFFLKPQGQDTTYGVDAALLYDFQLKSKNTSLFAYTSYDRNTAIETEQNLLTAGFGWERQADLSRRGWGPVYTATADYKRDGTASGKGGRLTTGLTIDSELKGKKGAHPNWYPGSPGPRRASKYFSWQWEWAAYVQWDKTASAGNGGPEGDIFRSFSDLSACVYPGGEQIKNQVELVVSYRYIWDFNRSRQFDVGDSTVALFKSSLNLYLTEDRKYGLGVDYSRGGDPVEGLAKQTFYKVSFKAQI